MSANVNIRPASAADIAHLVDLVREYWTFEGIDGFHQARTRACLRFFFKKPALGCLWLAEQESTPVGYLLACYVFSLEHGGLTAEIDEFFLLPEHRGAGLGRRLLETAEKAFVGAGCTNVALQLSHANDPGRAFYTHFGYHAREGYDLLDKMLAPHAAGHARH